MKSFVTALGFGAIATALIGGIVVAVSLLDHRVNKDKTTSTEAVNDISEKVSENPSNQPIVSEKVQYLGWEDIDENSFKTDAEDGNKYKPCYCTVYSDDYVLLTIPVDGVSDEYTEICFEPWKVKEQDYIPYEYTTVPGYYLNCKTGEAWSVKEVNYEFLGGFISSREEVAK